MTFLELQEQLSNIMGLRLTDVYPACEMLMFSFDNYALHSECLTRIIKDNDILLTTLDYQSWDGEISENNDEWHNLEKYKETIVGGRVVKIELSSLRDLTIVLDNNITIQLFISNGYPHYYEDTEQYRFFECSENEWEEQNPSINHYVVYSKSIEIQ